MTRYDQPDLLMWLDLETTGTDHVEDQIIEIGAIFTTPDLDELGSFQRTVRASAEALGRLMLNPEVRKMHSDSGLLDEVLAVSATEWEGRLGEADMDLGNAMGTANVESGRTWGQPLVLAGSGVAHFDRRFIDAQMELVEARLRYWCIDVGVTRRSWRMAGLPHPMGEPPEKPHRALDDARLHLAEERAFRDVWNTIKENPS